MGFEPTTFPVLPGRANQFVGGANGIRTHDLLDAIEARSQLRHCPTEGKKAVIDFIAPGDAERQTTDERTFREPTRGERARKGERSTGDSH